MGDFEQAGFGEARCGLVDALPMANAGSRDSNRPMLLGGMVLGSTGSVTGVPGGAKSTPTCLNASVTPVPDRTERITCADCASGAATTCPSGMVTLRAASPLAGVGAVAGAACSGVPCPAGAVIGS